MAGDTFAEEFVLANRSRVPVLWAEAGRADPARLRGGPRGRSRRRRPDLRWRTGVECRTGGVYRIGPAVVNSADPFGLFRLELIGPATDSLLIYPCAATAAIGAAHRARPAA
ncbi:MAG: hypothetical protein R3A10_14390 [Caldilineaceae bacterium]